jgi:predicted NBD/HSP70 family sugar kinase
MDEARAVWWNGAMQPRPRETRLLEKRHRILGLLLASRTSSRLEIARRLNINASMAGRYVDALLREGLLLEDHAGGSRRGRTPVAVRLAPSRGCFLGVDFEALRTRALLTDFAGEPLARREVPFPAGTSKERILATVLRVARALAGRRRLLGVGVAAPGQVDPARGVIVRYPLVEGFSDVPVKELFERRFSAPVHVEHNIRALTRAEMLRGAGQGLRDVLVLAVRSGLGLGIVLDGRIREGARGRAGTVGATCFPTPAGPRPLTELVSATGILRAARAARRGVASLEAAAADPRLRRVFEEAGTHLGLLAANLANLFAPERIVFAGEVPRSSPFLRRALEDAFRRHVLPELLPAVALADSALEGYGAALGAACLGFSALYPVDPAAIERSLGLLI